MNRNKSSSPLTVTIPRYMESRGIRVNRIADPRSDLFGPVAIETRLGEAAADRFNDCLRIPSASLGSLIGEILSAIFNTRWKDSTRTTCKKR